MLVSGLFALLGLTVGSFLNVVIHRLPLISERDFSAECRKYILNGKLKIVGMDGRKIPWFNKKKLRYSPKNICTTSKFNLSFPRSHCPHCLKTIRLIDNIPLFSYLFLLGKCRNCAQRISPRYPVVELLSSLGAFYLSMRFGVSYNFGTEIDSILKITFYCIFFWSCIALGFIDFYTKTLPDLLTISLLWLGILFSMSSVSSITLESSVLGAVGGYLSLWLIYQIYKLITGKIGMGHGDFKLVGAICAWVGIELLAPLLLISSASGALVGTSLILLRKLSRDEPIAFGPFLIVSGFVLILF